jgi:hypothetical protein
VFPACPEIWNIAIYGYPIPPDRAPFPRWIFPKSQINTNSLFHRYIRSVAKYINKYYNRGTNRQTNKQQLFYTRTVNAQNVWMPLVGGHVHEDQCYVEVSIVG